MNQVTQDIGQKLWNLCNLLRDDGVTYHQYVTELTYLLFLKMAKETGAEEKITAKYRWDRVEKIARDADLDAYKELLLNLGRTNNVLVKQIFANATTAIRKPKTLSELVKAFDELNWYSVDREQMGDLYEDLLERNASEKKSGAGQYFTPRPLIDCMVSVMQPSLDDVIQDPAAGTAGFLISAWQFINKHHDVDSLSVEKVAKLRRNFHGMELVQDAHRLALMNLMLHGFEHVDGMHLGDTLTDEGAKLLPAADLILTNPPFGTKKGGGVPSRSDFVYLTSNKQLAFVEHIYKNLRPGGRAAVVVPDNVLFEGNTGVEIRRDLMNKCRLHTILRLPTGIFYAQGVKTNVLFFTKVSDSAVDSTKEVWVYDLRANMPAFGKRTPLTREHFAAFEKAFGKDPRGESKSLAKRKDEGEQGRFRRFTRDDVSKRGDSLDIVWLRDESDGSMEELPKPAALVRQAMGQLEQAMDDLRAILVKLGEGESYAAVDTCNASLEAIPAILKRFRQSVLAAATSGELTKESRANGGLAENWEPVTVADIAAQVFDVPFGSNLKSSDYTSSGTRVIRLENIGSLKFDDSKQTFISNKKAESLIGRHELLAGDVLFSSFVDEEVRVCLFSQHQSNSKSINKADVFCVRVDQSRCDPRFIALRLAARATYTHLRSQVHGATRPRINLTQLKQLRFLLPPLPEQRAVVEIATLLLAHADKCAARLDIQHTSGR